MFFQIRGVLIYCLPPSISYGFVLFSPSEILLLACWEIQCINQRLYFPLGLPIFIFTQIFRLFLPFDPPDLQFWSNFPFNFFFVFCLFVWHMAVPQIKLELQLPTYAIAAAMPDPSHICNLRCGLRQHQILNSLSKARD